MSSKTIGRLKKWGWITIAILSLLNTLGFPIRSDVITGVQVVTEAAEQIDQIVNSDDPTRPVVDHFPDDEEFIEEESETLIEGK